MESRLLSFYAVFVLICLCTIPIYVFSNMYVDCVVYPDIFWTKIMSLATIVFSIPFLLVKSPINWKMVYKHVCRCLNIMVFFECLLALMQKVFEGVAMQYCPAGAFKSPTSLIVILVLSFPVGLVYWKEYGKKEKTCLVLSKFLSFITIILYSSRISFICVCVDCLFILYVNNKIRFRHVLLCVGSIIPLAAYLVKFQSTIGRYFILYQTIGMIRKKAFLGWGHNGFVREYMNEQARYFSENPDSPYATFAGNIHHPLNEFLLIAVDYGVPLVLLLMAVCFLLCRYGYSTRNRFCAEGLLIFTNIIILSFFTYPFHFSYTWLMTLWSVGLMLHLKVKQFGSYKMRMLIIVVLCSFISILLPRFIKELKVHNQWKEASELHGNNKDALANTFYGLIYANKKNDYRFLYDYACFAYNMGNYPAALKLAKEANAYISDYNLELLIADIYNSMYDDSNSIERYKRASDMCPSRVVPVYEQYMIYSRNNDTLNCLKLYNQIANKRVKVYSTLVNCMLNDIKKDINRFN